MRKFIFLFLITIFSLAIHSYSQQNTETSYPEPEFEGYTLSMTEAAARAMAPLFTEIPVNSLVISGIYYQKDNVKYSLWFYKGKLQGINVNGKYDETAKKELVKKYRQSYGDGGYTFEFGFDHYYWYFYRGYIHYTIEIKHYLLDIHYSISDTGRGRE